MSIVRMALRPLIPVLLLASSVSVRAQVLTSQNNNARTSANLHETTLTPANVNPDQFGRVFSLRVDGDVYAQPLYLPNVEIPGKGRHNVLFVATEHDSVYAFDASGQPAEPLWHLSFLDSKAGVTTLPALDVRCPFIAPEVGITPTPVIDAATGTLFVLARSKESQGFFKPDRYVQRLHALAVTTGAEKFGGPISIEAPRFDALRELPRAGLLLSGGHVYLTWASSCDVAPYHGWVIAYDARTLAQTAVFNTSPGASESGIWQADNAPAADAEGHVYVTTGNGKFDPGLDYGDSILELTLQGRHLAVSDSFTPADQAELNDHDLDLGSGGPMLTPEGLLLAGGKASDLYVFDHSHLAAPRRILRTGNGIYSAPAYWNGHVYLLASGDYLLDFAVNRGRLSEAPVATGWQRFGNPGATPAISANGTRDGIVWLIETKSWNGADRPAVLHAYDARNIARELYDSEKNAARDRAGKTLRFTIPTVADGRVYIEAKGEIDVYGLLPKP